MYGGCAHSSFLFVYFLLAQRAKMISVQFCTRPPICRKEWKILIAIISPEKRGKKISKCQSGGILEIFSFNFIILCEFLTQKLPQISVFFVLHTINTHKYHGTPICKEKIVEDPFFGNGLISYFYVSSSHRR